MRLSSLFLHLLILLLPVAIAAATRVHTHSNYNHTIQQDEDGLSINYYSSSCPNFEAIVYKKMAECYAKDWTLAAGIIRLLFYDCAVRGCDASILLSYPGSEKDSHVGKTLRGFEVINDIKKEVEKLCPKTVSCADILVAASRDATRMVRGPYWENKYGRKDGSISLAKEGESTPMGHEDITYLIQYFQAMNLSHLDLVVLSGAHTIGRCHCESIQYRLYNHSGVLGAYDPTIAPKYLNDLRRKCRSPSEYLYLDANTPFEFDKQYYKNLKQHMGLLETDQLLYSDNRTRPIVLALADTPNLFYQQFAMSMAKLAAVNVLLDDEGEVRTNCRFVNER